MQLNTGGAERGAAATEDALKLWRHVFGGERGLIQVFTGVRGSDGRIADETIVSEYFDYPKAAKRAAEWALEKSEAGREVYFCAHLLTGRKRVKETAAPIVCLWGDLDGAAIPDGAFKPTAVVESSPGRWHAYWRLADAIPPGVAEDLNRRLAGAIMADRSGFDLTQLLRVPGTLNHKYPDRSTRVKVRELDAARAYCAGELDRGLPKEADGRRWYAAAPPVVTRIPPGRRNEELTSLAGTMRRRGMGEEEMFAALAVANRKRCDPPLEEKEVRGIARSVARYEPAGEKANKGFEEIVSQGEEGGGAKSKPRNQADRLIDYALESGAELFVDQLGSPHALVDGEAVPLNTGAYDWLRRLMWDLEGISVGGEALKTAAGTLAAFASASGKVRELHTRSAFYEGAVYYLLGKGRVVRIDRDGWRRDEDPPVVFRTVRNLKPLPDPEPGGSLDEIEELVNLKNDSDKRLLKAYFATVPLPHVFRPMLQTTGVMGSGKTTAGRVVKRTWDPTAPETVRMDPREFLQKASHCFIVMLDNLNSIPEWGVDTLCRLVTGEGDSKRSLYTDDEDFIYEMRRAVVLNGINPPTDRGDAQDRTLPVELDRIPDRERRTEEELWEEFGTMHGRLLGAAFDALAGAIRARETLKLRRRPRLADWGEYAAGVYEALGWGSALFLEDWEGVVRTQNQATLDGSLVAQVIVAFMENHRGDYEGVASDLHRRLELRAEELDIDVKRAKGWPKSPSWLWRRMKDVHSVLAAMGIIVSKRPGEAGSLISLKKDPLGPPDPGSSREKCFQESPAASRMLPGGNADTYAESESTGSTGSKNGHPSGSLSRITEGGGVENGLETPMGREVPTNASSASRSTRLGEADEPDPVAAYLAKPPKDVLRQAEKCTREGGTASRLFEPLVSAVAYGVYRTAAGRCDEVRPRVEAWLREIGGC